MRIDFRHFLYTELLSARAQQTNLGQISRAGRQHHRRASGNGHALLLLLLYPYFHRLYESRPAPRHDLFLLDFFAHGGFGLYAYADELFRQ